MCHIFLKSASFEKGYIYDIRNVYFPSRYLTLTSSAEYRLTPFLVMKFKNLLAQSSSLLVNAKNKCSEVSTAKESKVRIGNINFFSGKCIVYSKRINVLHQENDSEYFRKITMRLQGKDCQ